MADIVPPPIHPARLPVPDWAEHFWSRVDRTDSCWLWTGSISRGYGQYTPGYRSWGTNRAHRISFLWFNGSIPSGMVLDHLCRVRNCVNPEHLDPITDLQNKMRGEGLGAVHAAKTHCPAGHELPPYRLGGKRACRLCQRVSSHYARPTESSNAGVCSGCGRVRHVRVNGVLHKHQTVDGMVCPGSGRPPQEEVA